MLKWLTSLIDRTLILFAKKTSSGTYLSGWVQAIVYGFPAIILTAIMMLLVAPQLSQEALNMEANPLTFNISNQLWFVSLDKDTNIDNFWNKAIVRDKSQHHQYLDKHHNSYFWLGLKITPEMKDRIIKKNAYQFLVGQIFGTFQTYVDGELVKQGGFQTARDSVIIDFRYLLNSKNLKDNTDVLFKIKHDMREPFPDMLHISGFATDAQISSYNRWLMYDYGIANSIALGFGFCLGFFFLALWLCSVRKQEVAAFSAFGMLHAVIQAGYLPPVWDRMGADVWHRLNFVTTCYESLFILWLGFALARIRNRNLLVAFVLFLLLPWGIYFTNLTPYEIYHIVLNLWALGTTYSYFIVAILCFSQARLVKIEHQHMLNDALRVKKLYISTFALSIMGVVQYHAVQTGADARIYNIFLLTILAAFVVHDYRRQDVFLKKSPLSKYHQRATLPEQVDCVMATIDLKKSELLYNFGSHQGVGASYVVDIISRFFHHIIDKGGEVIQTEGDAITFFFEKKTSEDTFKKMIDVLNDINHSLEAYISEKTKQFAQSANFPDKIRIRAAIEEGSIRPVWQNLEGTSKPSWEQTGTSKIFVSLARLLEAESKSFLAVQSTIIYDNELNKNKYAENTFDTQVEIKHGRTVSVSIVPL